MLDKAIDRLCRLFAVLMVACLAGMVVMVFGNVVLRYGFNSGITASEELSRWLFVWMTFWARWWRCTGARTWAPTRWCRACRPPARRPASSPATC